MLPLCACRSRKALLVSLGLPFVIITVDGVQVRRSEDGAWQDLVIPKAVRAIVMINLQTYMGGRDLWGLNSCQRPEEKTQNLVKPIFDDGLLEVVYFWSCASHTLTTVVILQSSDLKQSGNKTGTLELWSH